MESQRGAPEKRSKKDLPRGNTAWGCAQGKENGSVGGTADTLEA